MDALSALINKENRQPENSYFNEEQFVEDAAEDQKGNLENIACIPEEGGSVIDLDYQTNGVEY